jgi:general stress protein 26
MSGGGLSEKEARAKAEKLMGGTKTIFLATNGSHGHPDVRAMSPVLTEGVKEMYFVTALFSNKLKELQNDDKAVVYAYSPRSGTELRLWGTMEIRDDAASKKRVWNDDLKEHFELGVNDPSLVVLQFSAISGSFTSKDGRTGVFSV